MDEWYEIRKHENKQRHCKHHKCFILKYCVIKQWSVIIFPAFNWYSIFI